MTKGVHMLTVNITRESVPQKLAELNGSFFYVEYTSKQTGEDKSGLYTTNVRKYGRTGKGLSYAPTEKRLTQVTDMIAARRAKRHGGSSDRMLWWDGVKIIRVRAKGIEYHVH